MAATPTPATSSLRADESQKVRISAANSERDLHIRAQHPNHDETEFPEKFGNFSKGLPHDAQGRVEVDAYKNLVDGLNNGEPNVIEASITLGGEVPLVNPQAGLAYDLEGGDCQRFTVLSPPKLNSLRKSAEAIELYWMALLRDVPFSQYDDNKLADHAIAELSGLAHFSRSLDGIHEPVTAKTLFRGFTDGDLKGPYISQFLYQNLQYGAINIVQRFQTLKPVSAGGTDWMTDFPSWLACQNGSGPLAAAWTTPGAPPNRIDETPRYIRSGRDISQYVHTDVLFEAYFNACLYLIHLQPSPPWNPAIPYQHKKQAGFGTFGSPHVKALVAEVATRALKAAWYQKWFVHRHLRPEAYGGLVDNSARKIEQAGVTLPGVLDSKAVQQVLSMNKTALLPHAFPEGCPQHPSFVQGHGTVAGACTTVLKAFFDETTVIRNPMIPNEDGTQLLDYSGPDTLNVGGELNKLAANIALGRNHAAVHWRSDYNQSLLLGQEVAVSILKDQLNTYRERSLINSWTFTGFDGKTVQIA